MLSVSHCSRDNRPDRDHLQAQCFTGRPSDTPAVETTGQAEHACNTPSSGTRPEARQQPKTYATRMHAPAAPAPAAPQPTSTGPAQRRSVSLTAAETTGPAEDDLCPAQLGYTPLRPLYPQRQTTQRGPAQQHLLQWRQPAQQTIDTANHRPAQQRPCGRDNRPGQLHLSKSTPPLCSPFVATAQTIQPWTIVKHPGRTMGYTSYSPFLAL
jgi:hypothetical protein